MNTCRFKENQILFFLFCIAIFFFSSCEKEKETSQHTIDYRLEPYLNRFVEEGKKRGKFVDIGKEGGLILEFADLTPPTIGLCYPHAKPVRIQIDRTYWEETTQSPNRENLREEVIFHELGHGFIGKRGHKNSFLPNEEWASMMCGEPQINGRSWFLNFNGYRKDYYLDELFNPKTTTVPEWSKPAVFDGNKGMFLLDERNSEFKIPSSSGNQNLLASLYSTESFISTDFYMEMEIAVSFVVKDDGGFSGIFAGNKRLDDYNYFTIEPNNRSVAANHKCRLAPFAEVSMGDKYKREGYNKLAISKRGNELFFYVNDQLVYRNDYQIPSYNTFGIIVPVRGSVSIKNFAIYADESVALRVAKQAENPVILGEVSIPGVRYLK